MQLSVIIPTYNRYSLLLEAIHSVISLNIPVEIIVCDDGSTDDVSALCGNLSSIGDQVIWSRTEQCYGAQVARNRGLVLARGEAVLFMDSDDVLADAGILPLLQALEDDPFLDYAFGKVVRTDNQLKPLPGVPPIGAPFSDAPIELAGYHWHTMGALYRRRYLERVGNWNEALTGSQDWEYQARVKIAGGRGRFIDTAVGYWREHDGSRVGAKVFRPDYVSSVMLACDSILQQARKVQRCDRALERRLAKKYIIHALEYGANGYHSERKQYLSQALNALSDDQPFEIAIKFLRLSPAFMDSWVWGLLTK